MLLKRHLILLRTLNWSFLARSTCAQTYNFRLQKKVHLSTRAPSHLACLLALTNKWGRRHLTIYTTTRWINAANKKWKLRAHLWLWLVGFAFVPGPLLVSLFPSLYASLAPRADIKTNFIGFFDKLCWIYYSFAYNSGVHITQEYFLWFL